jgi:hypothetical protein
VWNRSSACVLFGCVLFGCEGCTDFDDPPGSGDGGTVQDATASQEARSSMDAADVVEVGPDGDAAKTDSSSCSPVLAFQYDQSCTVDTDCVAVGQVSSCSDVACVNCMSAAINKSAAAEYAAAFQQAAGGAAYLACPCPCESGAICRGGKCQAASCGAPPGDTLPACANVGGSCAYSANTTCNGVGPPGSCAYSDEFCCLPY